MELTVTEALDKLQREAHLLSLRRNALQAELEDVAKEAEAVTAEYKAVQEVAVRFGVIEEEKPQVTFPASPWLAMNRQEAALATLQELRRPLHLKEIVSFLKEKGRTDDTPDLLSAALSVLRSKKGAVEARGGGVWALAGTNDNPEGLRHLFGQPEAEVG